MEGPTPVSALIHAATMVTAGVYLIARMHPLFELAPTAQVVGGIIGLLTLLIAATIGLVVTDLKRVIAYSTMSQIGYMIMAVSSGIYVSGLFHLMTHAFFKALLFLAAGSVIMGMHHDQDIRNMGGLRKYMPITWITALLGSLALIGTPLFAGFYSKDSIILAVEASTLPGAGFATFAVIAGVFVTAFYSFRMYFLVFHGKERFHDKPFPAESHGDDEHAHADEHADHHHAGHDAAPHESPWVVTAPLILLAIPSVVIGFLTIQPMLHGEFFKDSIFVDAARHPAMAQLAEEFHGATAMAIHGLMTLPFWLAVAGVATAYLFYMVRPGIPAAIHARFGFLYRLLDNKYYMDAINEKLIAPAACALGRGFWRGGDVAVIDGAINGSARLVGWLAQMIRQFQSGYIYHYALVMIGGMLALMTWFVWRTDLTTWFDRSLGWLAK